MHRFLQENAGTLRRALVLIVGMGAVLLNKRLGLCLDVSEQGSLVALISAYLLGSNYREAAAHKAKTSAKKGAK